MLQGKLSIQILSWKILRTKEGYLGQQRNYYLKRRLHLFLTTWTKQPLPMVLADSLFVKLRPFVRTLMLLHAVAVIPRMINSSLTSGDFLNDSSPVSYSKYCLCFCTYIVRTNILWASFHSQVMYLTVNVVSVLQIK